MREIPDVFWLWREVRSCHYMTCFCAKHSSYAHIYTNELQQSFNPRPLIKYMEKLGVPYFFLDSDIFDVCSIFRTIPIT